jgi:Leucine-rich repeat (LRR) protein
VADGSSEYARLVPTDKRFVDRLVKDTGLALEYLLNVGENVGLRDGRVVRLKLSSWERVSIDVSVLTALEDLRIRSAKLSTVTLGALPQLVRLDLGECALTELDLSGCSALEVVKLQANRLTKIPPMPGGLLELDVGRNPLSSVTIRSKKLQQLDVASCGLDALDVSGLPALTTLSCDSNRIGSLDLRALSMLESLECDDNGAKLSLPEQAPISKLSLRKNPLESLSADRYPLLETLLVDGTSLESLRLDNPKLTHLDCSDNRLAKLDLSRAPALRRLDINDNALTTLDLRPLKKLERLSVDSNVEVLATDFQKHMLPTLRERAGLPKPTKTLAKMDTYQLHAFAVHYNWDDGVKPLFDVIKHPKCQLATALLIYWSGEPSELSEYKTPKDAPHSAKKVVELLRVIEDGVRKGRFKRGAIPFDVHDVNGVDLSDDDPAIPDVMREVIEPPSGS